MDTSTDVRLAAVPGPLLRVARLQAGPPVRGLRLAGGPGVPSVSRAGPPPALTALCSAPQPGDIMNDPGNNCTLFSCMKIHNQLVSSVSNITCPDFDPRDCLPVSRPVWGVRCVCSCEGWGSPCPQGAGPWGCALSHCPSFSPGLHHPHAQRLLQEM